MSPGGDRGAIVIDTGVLSADLIPKSPLPAAYLSLIAGRPAFISFQTVAELRYGAMRRGWGPRDIGSPFAWQLAGSMMP